MLVRGVINARRPVLIMTHPSHELRVWGWFQRARPMICVLTDGGGRSAQPRIDATARLIDGLGCRRGPVFGAYTDAVVYDAILAADFHMFEETMQVLADLIIDEHVDLVVGDCAEGHNTAHDALREVINGAVQLATRRTGRPLRSMEFTLFGPPDFVPEGAPPAVTLDLADLEFAAKLEAVRGFNAKLAAEVDALLKGQLTQGVNRFSEPRLALDAAKGAGGGIGLEAMQEFPELATQILAVVSGLSIDAFRRETFWPVVTSIESAGRLGTPFYELYGEALVAAGRYEKAIRFRDHMFPLQQRLRDASS
jgi:hypothetical protein